MGEVRCPVLTMKSLATDPHSDAQWMTAGHLVVAPNDTIAIARKLMDQRNFGSLPDKELISRALARTHFYL